MASKHSAGLLLFRRPGAASNAAERPSGGGFGADTEAPVEVLIGHMGGPFWARKDAGAWSVPKGEYEPAEEEPIAAARREFTEELGLPPPDVDYLDLGSARQSGGKQVAIWAAEGDLDPARVVPGTFEMEWPPRSGRTQEFPEIDRAAWFGLDEAREKLVSGQRVFLDRLVERLAERLSSS